MFVARCRFRDHDGVTRHIRAHGASQTAARTALHRVILERQPGRGSLAGELTPASTFAEGWLIITRDRRIQEHRAELEAAAAALA